MGPATMPLWVGVCLVQAVLVSSLPSYWGLDHRLLTPSQPNTSSIRQQVSVEQAVWDRYLAMGAGEKPLILESKKHIDLLRKTLMGFPEEIPPCFSASIPWCYYWVLHSLDMLGAVDGLEAHTKTKVVESLRQCYNVEGGGFGGGPGQDSHVCSTYAAVASLVILGVWPEWLDRDRQHSFLLSLKDRHEGSFRTTPDEASETDARACYCALAVAHLLDLPVEEGLAVGCEGYLQRLQTYEGGFAAEEGGEAHCGFTYCAVAALSLLGTKPVDVPGCVRWATRRQRCFEGGFNGRANKLVDVCYSFWCGALFPLLGYHSSFNATALQRYIVGISQNTAPGEQGGFADKPGTQPDYYHTCYALSGLSVARHLNKADGPCYTTMGPHGDSGIPHGDPPPPLPREIDPLVNVCCSTLEKWWMTLGKRR